MRKLISPSSLGCLALFCFGCSPQKGTSPAMTSTAPAKATLELSFQGSGTTYSIRFSPDGKTLASVNADKTVSLWDVQTQDESAKLSGHRFTDVSIAFSPDGNFLASAGGDYTTRKGEILIWDIRTKSVRKTLATQDVYFSFVCFSLDGKTLATTGPRTSITLWDVETWTQKGTLQPHNNRVHCLEFSPDGKLLAAGLSGYNRETQQAEVKLWNMESGEEIGTLEHRWAIHTLCFSPDGKTLAVADDGQVILWDVQSQVATTTFEDAWSWATISPDGSLIAMRRRKMLTLHDIQSGKEIVRQEVETHAGQAFFSPDGKWLAWGSVAKDKPIRLWDLTDVKSTISKE